MIRMLRNKNFYIIFLSDACLVIASLYVSFLLRFEFQIPSGQRDIMISLLPFVFVVKMATFIFFQLYGGLWRYTNLSDLLNVAKAVATSSALLMLTLLAVFHFQGYPRSVFILDSLLTFIFIGGIRAGIRLYFLQNSNIEIFPLLAGMMKARERNVLIVRLGSFFVDAGLVVLALYLSYAIRFEFEIPRQYFLTMLQVLPSVFIVKMGTFVFFRMYQGMRRYTSLVDLLVILKACIVSTVGSMIIVLVLFHFQGYPRSVFVIDWGITLLFVGGIRVAIRLYLSRNKNGNQVLSLFKKKPLKKRLLIIGAGDSGEKMLREILDNSVIKLEPVGFLDDNVEKQERTIHGVKVLGRIDQIELFQPLFDEILIAIPSATGLQMRRIVELCEKTGKRFRTIPSIEELINGKVSIATVRDVTLQDLLGREEVHLNKEDICRYLYEKRVLVTGAGGSIGSELVRQVSRFQPQAVALVEMSEFNLFRMQMECLQRFNQVKTSAFLADIRDRDSLHRVFQTFQPQVVFHTAAYKHVPIQELHPWEAVRNNVLGTRNLVQISKEFDIEKFVLVSTDKAVRPTNVMGATKRVAEKLVVCANGNSDSRFIVVRFGNVLGSSGSVIPTFQEQISRGGPVTVTHPDVTRYFMSIPEAALLILEAGSMGQGGEIFLLDMGKPVRIVDLAKDIIRFHGYQPDQDIEIRYIGLRPGEKLYEELITQGEGIVETRHEKIMVLRGNGYNLPVLQEQIDALLQVARTFDEVKIKHQLQKIVPDYTPEFKMFSCNSMENVVNI